MCTSTLSHRRYRNVKTVQLMCSVCEILSANPYVFHKNYLQSTNAATYTINVIKNLDSSYLDGKTVAVECSLKVLIKSWCLQRPVLLLGREKEASSIRQCQGLSRSIEESLLTPAVKTFKAFNNSRCTINSKHVITMNDTGSPWINYQHLRHPVVVYSVDTHSTLWGDLSGC